MRSEKEIREMINKLWERYELAEEMGAVISAQGILAQIQILKWVLGDDRDG